MSGSTRQFKKKLIYVVPKDRLKSPEDMRTVCKCLQEKHRGCIEVVASEEQYNVKFHGVFRDDGSRK